MPSPDCYSCRQGAASALPPREQLIRTPGWRVAHAFDSSLGASDDDRVPVDEMDRIALAIRALVAGDPA